MGGAYGHAAPLPAGTAARVSEIASAAIMPVATGLLFYAAVAQGGFYRAQGSLFAAGCVALGLATIGAAPGLAPLLAGAAALSLGLVASGLANGWGANTPQIVAALCAGVAVVPVARRLLSSVDRERFLSAIAWLGAVASVAGMIGVAFHQSPWSIRASGLWRNASTLTYANAAGCLFVLTLGAPVLLLAQRSTASRRFAAFLLLAGLGTTLSRGALIGCAVAVVVLAVLRHLAILRALVRPALGALIALAGLLPSIAGARPQPLAALAGIGAGALIAIGTPGARRTTPKAVLAAVAVAALGALVASGAPARVLERRALPASETRLRTWGATFDLGRERPWLGHGPGTFAIVEEDRRQGPVLTRYAHNEYLQAFFETGAVGVAGIAGAMAIFGAWAWRRRPAADAGAWAVGCALCAGFAANSAFDFLWRFPLLVALGFIWLAVAITPPPTTEEAT